MNRSERRALDRKARKDTKRSLPLLQQRSCGSCTACCTTLRVDAIEKPDGAPCPHEGPPGKPGCTIYERRPAECSVFFCAWRIGVGRESERPDRVGYLVYCPSKTAGRLWFAVRDVREGSGAGWAARDRIEALAFEHNVGIGICTPLTAGVVRDLDALGPATGELPPMGTRATFFFGPPLPRLVAQQRFAADD